MKRYTERIEHEMRIFYQSLNEKDRCRYAAVEALKLEHGGQVYIAEVLGCDRNTIAKGIRELQSGQVSSDETNRIRRVGGGRKRAEEADASIEADFLMVMANYTAGDPMDASVRWTSLSPREIAVKLNERREQVVGRDAVRRLLAKHGYKRRKISKKNDEGGGKSK
jgi:hypothetical protein